MSFFKDLVRDALTRVPEISSAELAQRQGQGVVIDVREHDEIASGILPGAIVLPRGLVEKHAQEHLLDRAKPVFVYSGTGQRSALVCDVLKKMGYEHVHSLAGGIERWRHDGRIVSGGAVNVCRLPGVKLSWEDVRKEFAIVGRNVPVLGSGERPLVYLDHAASTHAPHTVLAAFVEFMEREYANVHRGTHLLSRKATERFEEAYYVVADFIGAELRKGCVVFTANTTHAIDLCSHVMSDRPG